MQVVNPSPAYPLGYRTTEPTPAMLRPLTRSTSTATRELHLASVEFLSDHDVLLDNTSDWTGTGERFTKPDWIASDGKPGHPVSHSMDKHVVLKVKVEYKAPRGARPVRGTLIGEADGMLFKRRVLLSRGVNSVRIESDIPLERKVRKLDLRIKWRIEGKGIAMTAPLGHGEVLCPGAVSENEVFVTMGPPATVPEFPGVTYRRMAHAIREIGAAGNVDDPHAIVKKVIQKFNQRFLLESSVKNAWEIADDPSVGADCRTISRYIINLMKIVACPGEVEAVLVYDKLNQGDQKGAKIEHPGITGTAFKNPWGTIIVHGNTEELWIAKGKRPGAGDFPVVAEPAPAPPAKGGGLDRPKIIFPLNVDPHDPAKNIFLTATLFDDGFGPNNFEACIRLTYGTAKYYMGGVVGDPAADTPEQVLDKAFVSLGWATADDAGNIIHGEVGRIKNH